MNLRQRGCPLNFGDEASLHSYLTEVEVARKGQAAEFVVAPRVRVKLRTGYLEAGAEVNPADLDPEFDANGYRISGVALLDRLVERGFVLSKADGSE